MRVSATGSLLALARLLAARVSLETLCRYGARPPLSLERLSLLPDGRIAYRLRRPRRNGVTLLVLEPIAFMTRLAALIPPPRGDRPLTREGRGMSREHR